MNDAPNPLNVNSGAVEQTLDEIRNKVNPMNDSGIHDYDLTGDLPVTVEVNAQDAISSLRRSLEQKAANQVLRIKRLTPTAKFPTRGSAQAIGLDLYADEGGRESGIEILSGYCRLISTGIAMAIPPGYYGRIAPRSGLALKHSIDVLAGVVDSDYRGEVHVLLQNLDPWKSFWVRPGMRIAQLILERADLLPVLEVKELDDTARGSNGYGSTGV